MSHERLENRALDVSAGRPGSSAEDTIAWIVNEHGAAMLAYASRLTHNRAQAEQVVHEALIRAWHTGRGVGLDRQDGTLRGWLLMIVCTLVLDQDLARSTRAGTTRQQDRVTVGDRDGPARPSLSGATDNGLGERLAALSPEQRAVLVELYVRHRSVSQAAQTLAIATGSVKSRAFDALQTLRPTAAGHRADTPAGSSHPPDTSR
jgi:RNA polymerase sigma-70 factor, ECF subfamily